MSRDTSEKFGSESWIPRINDSYDRFTAKIKTNIKV